MDFRGEKGAACKKGLEGLIKSGLKRARVRKDAPLKGDFDLIYSCCSEIEYSQQVRKDAPLKGDFDLKEIERTGSVKLRSERMPR